MLNAKQSVHRAGRQASSQREGLVPPPPVACHLPKQQRPSQRRSGAQRVMAQAAASATAPKQQAAQSNGAHDPTHVSDTGLPRSATVGVLGGGQLGRMMALAAANLGVRMTCLDPTTDAPASWSAKHVLGHFRDADAIRQFLTQNKVDVLTTEIEHINVDAVEEATRALNLEMEPTPHTIRIIQDKYAQKLHFQSHGIPLPEFREINGRADMETTGRDFGFPFMLKSKRLAYDGKGNAVVRTAGDLDSAVAALGGYQQGLYAEKWAPFVKELAVMVVRSRDGSVVSYPVVETIHKDNICHVTEAPADAPSKVLEAAAKYAEKAIACLEGAGIFGVEMFMLADGSILLNEVAPRPHNSGHYTQDGCQTSQFENHVRAVLGWPLGDTSLVVPCSIMLNLLGEADGQEGIQQAHEVMARAYKVPGANVHWYGKDEVKKGRKIGHINIAGSTREQARARLAAIDPSAAASLRKSAAALAQAVGVEGSTKPAAQVGIIMGSDSDLATMKAAAQVLEEFGVPCEISVVSAHRTPERMMEYAKTAHKRGLKAIIAGAGGAAHLPGMVAAMTPLPVIGVPVKPNGAYLDGMDALLSIVQMPKGVPVATVAIGNAANAGLLAVRIIGSHDQALLDKMVEYQDGMRTMVLDKASKLEEQGWREYKVSH